MSKLTAYEVSRWFLMKNNINVRQYGDELLTHLKIQKLLYYAQGIFLAYTNGIELFEEEIYAWEHGPVVPDVYNIYKINKGNEIEYINDEEDIKILEKVTNDEDLRDVLEAVFENYGKYSAWHLRNMTHEEKPWKSTPLSQIISKNIIRDYFEKEILEA